MVDLLDIRNLVTRFHTDAGTIHAVAACWFDIRAPQHLRVELSVSPNTSDQIQDLA